MPRKNPIKKLDVIGPLNFKPERATREFLTSKAQDEFFVKPPNWDSTGDSIELFNVQNRREYDVMLRLQKEMLDTTERQAIVNENRTKRLYKTQAYLRKRFIEVNNFLKECSEKKIEAMKKVESESKWHKELRQGIEKYANSIEELSEFRNQLKQTVDEFEPYQRVMDEVVAKSNIFNSPKDCMNRCDALMLAQVEIATFEQQKLKDIEQMRQRMAQLSNEAAMRLLALKTELAEMERTYRESTAEFLKWEHILSKAKQQVTENDRDKIRSLDGVNNLYRIFAKRKDVEPKFQRTELTKQLDFIKDEIEILRKVAKECTKGKTKKNVFVLEMRHNC